MPEPKLESLRWLESQVFDAEGAKDQEAVNLWAKIPS